MAVFISGHVHAAFLACSTCVAWHCEEYFPHSKSTHCLSLNARKTTWPTGASSRGSTPQHSEINKTTFARKRLGEGIGVGDNKTHKDWREMQCSSVNRPQALLYDITVSKEKFCTGYKAACTFLVSTFFFFGYTLSLLICSFTHIS